MIKHLPLHIWKRLKSDEIEHIHSEDGNKQTQQNVNTFDSTKPM